MVLAPALKILFLEYLKNNKNELFGKHDNKVTRNSADKHWNTIFLELQALGAGLKDVRHLRHVRNTS